MSAASTGKAAAAAAALELVVAVAENDVIGRRNQLPWHLPADLRHFKSLTLGKPVLMGRKTYQSIGKALPGRTNIVLSRSEDFAPGDCVVVKTLDDARIAAGAQKAIMVIGGAEIYRQCLPLASRIHLTLVHTHIEDGDTIFADWRGAEWDEASREHHESDDKNAYSYSFITLVRSAALPALDDDFGAKNRETVGRRGPVSRARSTTAGQSATGSPRIVRRNSAQNCQ
jgi:dihydrofolate reductase